MFLYQEESVSSIYSLRDFLSFKQRIREIKIEVL